MRIEDAWIDDPVRRGEFEPPKLCLQVDEWPDESIPDSPQGRGWIVGKWGPFHKYSRPGHKVTAGDFNAERNNLTKPFQPLVDISLFLGRTEEYTDKYALALTRARQKVKQFAPQWRLLLADKEAQSGKILWIPVEKNQVCKFWLGGTKICAKALYGTARVKGIDIPYCREHMETYNNEHARKRVKAS